MLLHRYRGHLRARQHSTGAADRQHRRPSTPGLRTKSRLVGAPISRKGATSREDAKKLRDFARFASRHCTHAPTSGLTVPQRNLLKSQALGVGTVNPPLNDACVPCVFARDSPMISRACLTLPEPCPRRWCDRRSRQPPDVGQLVVRGAPRLSWHERGAEARGRATWSTATRSRQRAPVGGARRRCRRRAGATAHACGRRCGVGGAARAGRGPSR